MALIFQNYATWRPEKGCFQGFFINGTFPAQKHPNTAPMDNLTKARATAGGNIVETLLLERHAVSQEELEDARQQAETAGVRLEKYLVEKNLVSGAEMALVMSDYLRMPPLDLRHFTPNQDLLSLIPKETVARHLVVPIARVGRMLTVALGDPFDVLAVEEVQARTGLDVFPVVAPERQVAEIAQRAVQQPSQDLQEVLRDVGEQDVELGSVQQDELSLDEMLEGAEDAPVIRIVNTILVEALRKRASDIHLEPMEKKLRLRYRIDGLLYENPYPPKQMQSAIISRVKIMSNLDIAERRVPQDGRFKIKAMGKEVDVRVSTLPTAHGEKVVMRLLDRAGLATSLKDLGLDPRALDHLLYAIEQPHGMILATGPTGSGKTTTLYSALQEINRPGVNIITVEDPIEYQIPGINQVQTHPEVGLSFANGLRSILRQDPDIIMVGEIRDAETAAIGIQAALTGHLVLTTLHTNDSAGAVTRMLNMGIEPFLLASSLIMAQAQRLYRKLCPACKKARQVPVDILRANKIDPDAFGGVKFYEPRGCPKCNDIGYRGRAALMEILIVNEDIRQLILKEANAGAIRAEATRQGMVTLREAGLQRVREGITSIEEILRVSSGE
jgi:type IV pilus assembly protein PilB